MSLPRGWGYLAIPPVGMDIQEAAERALEELKIEGDCEGLWFNGINVFFVDTDGDVASVVSSYHEQIAAETSPEIQLKSDIDVSLI